MSFTELTYENNKGQLSVTGGEEGAHIIEVPETIGDVPVTCIEGYSFAGRMELQEIVLPRGIHTIGGHAFYNCKNLHRLELHDGVRELEDGAFKNCYRLTEIILHCHAGREGCLRNLLSDNIQELTLTVLYDDGDVAKMVFPTFEDDYVENTPARIFQAVSFGSGGLYRQCMQVGTLDYRTLDSLFDKSVREDRFEAGLMNAIYRLRYPYRLFRSAREHYEEYLRGNDREAGLRLIAMNTPEAIDGIRLMCERELIGEHAIADLAEAAQNTQDPALAGLLIQYRMEHFQAKRRTFDDL